MSNSVGINSREFDARTIADLLAQLADTAAFLDRMAACPDAEWWAADCRAMARKLRGET